MCVPRGADTTEADVADAIGGGTTCAGEHARQVASAYRQHSCEAFHREIRLMGVRSDHGIRSSDERVGLLLLPPRSRGGRSGGEREGFEDASQLIDLAVRGPRHPPQDRRGEGDRGDRGGSRPRHADGRGPPPALSAQGDLQDLSWCCRRDRHLTAPGEDDGVAGVEVHPVLADHGTGAVLDEPQGAGGPRVGSPVMEHRHRTVVQGSDRDSCESPPAIDREQPVGWRRDVVITGLLARRNPRRWSRCRPIEGRGRPFPPHFSHSSLRLFFPHVRMPRGCRPGRGGPCGWVGRRFSPLAS